MARIEGVDLPRDKRIEVALTYIYGIGRPTSRRILETTGVNPDVRVKDMTEADLAKLREMVGSFTLEGDLRREVQLNIKRLSEIGSYRGLLGWTAHAELADDVAHTEAKLAPLLAQHAQRIFADQVIGQFLNRGHRALGLAF